MPPAPCLQVQLLGLDTVPGFYNLADVRTGDDLAGVNIDLADLREVY